MSKKIMLLALSAISAALFVLPAMAMAEDVPLHVVPKPAVATAVSGGAATLSVVNGNTVTCKELTGSETWETSTTGTFHLIFKNDCTAHVGSITASCSEITSHGIFHLVTLPGKIPGILLTPTPGGNFASFTCGGIFSFTVAGNGIVGKITSPACGASSTTSTSAFEGTNGVQAQKEVEGTTEKYHLTSNGEEAAEQGSGVTNLINSTKLECT